MPIRQRRPGNLKTRSQDNRRCFECAWCVPDPYTGSGTVCRVLDKTLSTRDLWRKVCYDFDPIDPAKWMEGADEKPAPSDSWS